MSKLQQLKDEAREDFINKFNSVPAIANGITESDECCNCGEDLSLELYNAFSEGYKIAIDDVKDFIDSIITKAYEDGKDNQTKKIIGEIEKHYNLGREELIKIIKAKLDV